MTSFFKKINPNISNNSKSSPSSSSSSPKPFATTPTLNSNHNSNSIFDSPPISALPSPPVNHLKDELARLKNSSQSPPSSLASPVNIKTNHTTTKVPETKSSTTPVINTYPSKASSIDVTNIQASTPWRKKKLYNSPFPRFGHAVSSLTSNSGACYLMGGLSGNDVYGDMWVIEPIRKIDFPNYNSSYIASPIENPQKVPSPRTGHASILIGNAFIIFAGDTAINYDQSLDNNLYFFNISSLKWTITSPTGDKPCGRYGHQISVLNFQLDQSTWSSQLYVFGGQLNDQFFNDLWQFDLSKFKDPHNQWVKVKPLGTAPPKLSNYTMSAYNDKLFLYGGHNGETISDKLYCYDAKLNEWSICNIKGPCIPPPLFAHSATIFGSLLFIFGGRISDDDENSGDLFVIDISSLKCWKLQSNLPYSPGPRYGHSITVNPIDEKLIIMGGDIYDNDFNGIDDDSSIGLIDEAKFSLLSSVIYECDIKSLEQFLDRTTTTPVQNTLFPSSFGKNTVAHSQSNIDLTESPEQLIMDSASPDQLISSTPIHSTDEDEDDDYVSVTDDNIQIEKLKISDTNSNNKRSLEALDNIKTNNDNSSNLDNTKNDTIMTISNFQPDLVNDSILYKTPDKYKDTTPKQSDPVKQIQKPIITSDNANIKSLRNFNDVDQDNDDHLPFSLTTPSVVPFNNASIPFSPALVERDNIKLQRLIQIVNDVKSEMKLSVSQANSQITKLESEKNDLINQLNAKGGNTSAFIEENTQLKDFINNELSTIPELTSLIKQQKSQIDELTSKLRDTHLLNEKISKLELENKSLQNKLNSIETESYSKEVDLLTSKIDTLTSKWSEFGPHANTVEELKKINTSLSKQLDDSSSKFKEFEVLYGESKNSLNKSHKALLLSQSETNKLKDQINSLNNQLEELKMKKRVYSNSNSRKASSSNKSITSGGLNSTMISNSDSIGSADITENSIDETRENQNREEDDEDKDLDQQNISLIDDRYEIKIKDMEANLFIVSQERDQMRNELISLKKQIYNNRNNQSFNSSSSSPAI